MSMKNSNDTIGNRTRDLLAFSAVPQPTAPPRAPYYFEVHLNPRLKARSPPQALLSLSLGFQTINP